MNTHQPDNMTPVSATTDASEERVTVTSEAERRAHVAKWIARMHKTGAATLGSAMLFLPAVAGAQTAGDGLVNAAGIDGVRDVQLLDDGSARITLENGRVLNVSAGDVVVGASGEVQVSAQVADILADAAASPAAGGGGGAAGAIIAGAAAGVAGIAAASGGGGGGGGGGSDPAPVVLNASDVAGFNTFSDVFGRTPEGDPDRVTITVDDGEGIELTPGEDGDWDLPDDFADNFADREGDVTVSFLAEREIPDDEDENGTVEVIVEDGETLASQTLADGEPDFEETDTGSITLLVDTIRPTIDINEPITDGDVLNIAERGEDLTITGTTDAEDGQEVTVTVAGQTYTGTASGGVWSVAVPTAALAALPDDADITVDATVADAAGNPVAAPASVSFATDFTAPSITINDISDDNQIDLGDVQNGLEISGTSDAEDGQPVTVTFNSETYTTSVASGAWSVSVPGEDLDNLETGDTPEVSATVLDAAGNPPASPATRPLTVDLTGPGLTIKPIADDNVINADESMSDVTISGTTSNVGAGQDVTVTVNGTDLPVVQTDANGDWSVTLPQADAAGLGDAASVTVGASVEDTNGLTASATVTLETDFTAPAITIDTPIAGDDVLNIAEQGAGFDITGTTDAEDGQEVTVTLTGTVATSEVIATGTAQGGTWTVNFTPAQAADLDGWDTVNVEASVEDAAGNESQTTASFATDFVAPTVTVDDLAGKTAGAELTAADLVDGNGDALTSVAVNGTSDALGQTVTVAIGTLQGTGTVDQNGDWSVDFAPADLGSELSGAATATISVSVEDDAGNPGDGTLTLDVDLTLPEIAIDAPGDATVLGLDAFEDGLDVSGTTTNVPDGQQVTIEIVDGTDTVVATTTAQVSGNAWNGSFASGDVAALDDQGSFTLNARVNDGDFPVDASADIALSTDFAPELTVGEIGDEGVLILADIDPNNVSVSGTTRGVEAGQAVTVTLLDEGGAGIFSDNSATVAADGTWSLDLPSATVEDLEAGQTYDVQADVSNAAGRDAPQAQEQVVAYEAGAFILAEIGRASGTATFGVFGNEEVFAQENDDGFEIKLQYDADALTFQQPVPNQFNNSFQLVSGIADGSDAFTFIGINQVDQSTNEAIRVEDFDAPFFIVLSNVDDNSVPLKFQLISENFGDTSVEIGTDGIDSLFSDDIDTVMQGRGGDDAIDLSGAGVNTVQFEADATANGFDTVTDFSIGGPLPDRLGFAGLNNEDLRGDGDTFELLSGTDSVGANTGLIVFTTAMADLTEGSVQTAVDGLTGLSDGDNLYFLASDGTDAQLYEVQVQAGSDTVTDMAKFDGLGDLNGISEANILGFDATGTLT